MNINSKFPTVRDEVKQPAVKQPAKHGLMMILLIILASTGFSIEVEVHPFSFLKAAESVAHQLMNSCRGYFF